MNFPTITIKILIILIPGLIFVLLTNKFLIKKKLEGVYIGIYALVFGLMAYMILELFNGKDTLNVWQAIDTTSKDSILIDYIDIILSSLISVVIALLYTGLSYNEWDFKILNYFGITAKASDLSGYASYLKDKDVIYVIDHKNNIAYSGVRNAHSVDEKVREVILTKVTMYCINKTDYGFTPILRGGTDIKFDKLYLSFGVEDPISIIS